MKITKIFSVLLLTFALASCGNVNNDDTTTEEATTEEATTEEAITEEDTTEEAVK